MPSSSLEKVELLKTCGISLLDNLNFEKSNIIIFNGIIEGIAESIEYKKILKVKIIFNFKSYYI